MELSVFDSIVKIYEYTENKSELKGIGFVIKQEDDISYVLTCNHVVYLDSNDTKRILQVNNSTDVTVTYGHEITSNVDLALLKVKNLKNRFPISLQKTIEENSIIKLKTYTPIDNNKNLFDAKTVDLKYKASEPLDYCNHSSTAYLFHNHKKIVGGYSGSPIVDEHTAKVVGILNITREEESQECKGLAIENVLKIFPEIAKELEVVKKKVTKVTMVFKLSNEPSKYNIIVNNDDQTFKEIDIDDEEKQKELIDHIFKLTGKVRNKTIEFFLTPELFVKNIHLWKSSQKTRLVDKHIVYLRSLNLAETSGELKEYWEEKWDTDYINYQDDTFESSVTSINEDKVFHPDIVSAVCSSDTVFKENDFLNLEDDYISIAIWTSK